MRKKPQSLKNCEIVIITAEARVDASFWERLIFLFTKKLRTRSGLKIWNIQKGYLEEIKP